MTKKTQKPEEDTHQKTCFVITPIGDEHSTVRRQADGLLKTVITPVLENMGYKVIVAHEIATPGSIPKQIIDHVIDSDMVIADLTGLNPNVMYELAIRHCAEKPVVHIACDDTILPFDIRDQRTCFYVNDFLGAHKLKDDLQRTIAAAEKDHKSDNPISDARSQAVLMQHALDSADPGVKDVLELLLSKVDNLQSRPANNTIGRHRKDTSTLGLLDLKIENKSKPIGSNTKRNFLRALHSLHGIKHAHWDNTSESEITSTLSQNAPNNKFDAEIFYASEIDLIAESFGLKIKSIEALFI